MTLKKEVLLSLKSYCIYSEEDKNNPENDELVGAYDKNLISRHERTQDVALQDLYAGYARGIQKNQKMLDFCLSFGHKIMPGTAIWFVISYWMAGLFEYNRITFSLYITSEVIFTIVYVVTLLVANYLIFHHGKDKKKA